MSFFSFFQRNRGADLAPSSSKERLTAEEWARHYNASQVKSLIHSIENDSLSVQSREIVKIIHEGESSLEIGSGSGQSSLCLAKKGVHATALDYEQQCLDLTTAAAKVLNININTIKTDAEKPLPFTEDQFDYIFHAGLLEHYTAVERINLLKSWRPYSKKMVSMVPNAASLAYRVGKAIMEKNGTWTYGIETPLYSAKEEFIQAGYRVLEEYTIGENHALNFLPSKHYLRTNIERWINENSCEDNCGQGYLLVTIGIKE